MNSYMDKPQTLFKKTQVNLNDRGVRNVSPPQNLKHMFNFSHNRYGEIKKFLPGLTTDSLHEGLR